MALLAADHGRGIAGQIRLHLHAFFRAVDKDPDDVTTADVFDFVGRELVGLPSDTQQAGLLEPRLSSVVGFFAYLETRTGNPRANT